MDLGFSRDRLTKTKLPLKISLRVDHARFGVAITCFFPANSLHCIPTNAPYGGAIAVGQFLYAKISVPARSR
jgi:hypothetical protein